MNYSIYLHNRDFKGLLRDLVFISLYYLFRIFPLQNKVCGSTMRGRKYGDNPQFIMEELHETNPSLKYIWIGMEDFEYEVPNWMHLSKGILESIYHLATAKVWIDTHHVRTIRRKRKGQFFIETWHGGLGIKKIEGDIKDFRFSGEMENMTKLADLFISQSDHLSNIYRTAMKYTGPVWKIGYPKNDKLFHNRENVYKSVRNELNIDNNTKILLYAPTFRDSFEKKGIFEKTLYNINWEEVKINVEKKFGGSWIILIKWHPIMVNYIKNHKVVIPSTIDVTSFNDMQSLIMASDIMISDYSSCIFDAALLNIPCFTFATDFEDYKSERGVYYEMNELPFPYAKNNEELIDNINAFENKEYMRKWNAFKDRTGLYESGHAAKDIADKIISIINGTEPK